MPRVGLFIPCYIDQFYPRVGLATVELLERFGCEVDFPEGQTCCGQPMANSGCVDEARPLAQRFARVFEEYEYVVCPSGSCTAMVRRHYEHYFDDHDAYERLASRVFELTEFLVDILKLERVVGKFPYKVGLHHSCHGLRELRLGSCTEVMGPSFSKARQLLESLDGIELTSPTRPDECCGFGGTFAVDEESVSCMMGMDRLADHEQAGTDILTAGDMSCLMHLQGLISRRKKPLRVMHVAEILAGYEPPVVAAASAP